MSKVEMPSVEELYESKAHVGHLKGRSHPKSKDYIFDIKNRFFIIDLDKTVALAQSAVEFIQESAKQGKQFLVVGTKKQAKVVVERYCQERNIPYVSNKWLGGMLTNFNTITKSLKRLDELEATKASEDYAKKSKKYQSMVGTELERLHKNLDGVKNLEKLPDVLIAVDIKEERTAIKEATALEIPIVGIVDTDCDPGEVQFPIVANDDSFKTVDILVNLLTDAIFQGRKFIKIPSKEIKDESDGKN